MLLCMMILLKLYSRIVLSASAISLIFKKNASSRANIVLDTASGLYIDQVLVQAKDTGRKILDLGHHQREIVNSAGNLKTRTETRVDDFELASSAVAGDV